MSSPLFNRFLSFHLYRFSFYINNSLYFTVPFAVEERSGTITVVDDIEKFDHSLYDFEAVVSDGPITIATNVTIHVVDDETGIGTK